MVTRISFRNFLMKRPYNWHSSGQFQSSAGLESSAGHREYSFVQEVVKFYPDWPLPSRFNRFAPKN